MIAIDIEGNGTPLVLLHGLGTNRAVWRRVMPELARQRLACAPDLPGFGESSPAGPGFKLEVVADVLAEDIGERVQPPFDLLGHSLGGAVALVLATRRPEMVRRLLLLAPAGFVRRPPGFATVTGALGAPLLAARRRIGTPLVGSAAARRALLWGTVADGGRMPAADARAMLKASRDATRLPASFRAATSADLWPLLAELRAPLGLLWGDRDRVVPPGVLASILARAPEAAVETLRDCGHVPQLERSREFNEALERLLDRLAPVTAS